ncbi:hypothetical protein BpHYR1_049276 [Brachionus plicatilis]|uniref:Uncharacterized protein n=1 Tax=Brachionus plicatilis TaxID=10195 RepID=A0A3M7S0E3_BRAPC|nr:hypothetical protein BpHYR1_049276 [Brachionus plicatilis]
MPFLVSNCSSNIYTSAQKRLALLAVRLWQTLHLTIPKDFIVNDHFKAIYYLCINSDKLVHNFTQGFAKKLFLNEPLRFISRTSLLSCGNQFRLCENKIKNLNCSIEYLIFSHLRSIKNKEIDFSFLLLHISLKLKTFSKIALIEKQISQIHQDA